MSLDPKTPITLDLTLNEVEGVLAGLGELPTKCGAYGLMMKIQVQVQTQVPPPKEAEVEPETE